MHSRRLSTLLLGVWLGASLFMTWVATDNFASVERALKPTAKAAEAATNEIGVDRTRALLRYHSSEQNRHYFTRWGWAQLGLGLVLALVLLFATSGNTVAMLLVGGMLVGSAVQQFLIAPQVVEIGRALDFASVDEYREERRAFWNFHRSYSIVEVAKLVCGFALAGKLLFSRNSGRKRRRSRVEAEIDLINDPNNSHINR